MNVGQIFKSSSLVLALPSTIPGIYNAPVCYSQDATE